MRVQVPPADAPTEGYISRFGDRTGFFFSYSVTSISIAVAYRYDGATAGRVDLAFGERFTGRMQSLC